MCRTSLNTSFPSEHCCILHTLSQTTCMSWPWRPCRCWDNQDEIKVSIGNVGKTVKSCRHPWLEANTDFFKYFVIMLIMTRFSAFKRWADNTVAKGVAARAKLGALSSLSNAHFDISKFKQYVYTYSCMYQYEAGVGGWERRVEDCADERHFTFLKICFPWAPKYEWIPFLPPPLHFKFGVI